MQDPFTYERYQRQVILPSFGEQAQDKLGAAAVLVVGAGGLGCPLLQYLVAAGIGKVGIADDDVVALTNLQRQPLYSMTDIGKPKAEIAAEKLQAINPLVKIQQHNVRVTNSNAIELIASYDVVADASDNFATRYLVNDACVLLGKPLLFGAVSQWEGQLALFNSGTNAVNYRDLFPKQPAAGSVLNCAEAGVLGPLPGIIGALMANELVKFITGAGSVLQNKMLYYNARNNEQYVVQLAPTKVSRQMIPSTPADFSRENYEEACVTPAYVQMIDETQFLEMIQHEDVIVLDVREPGEQPTYQLSAYVHIPLAQLPGKVDALSDYDTIICICQTGARSRQAAILLQQHFKSSIKVCSLQAGITCLNKNSITE